MTAKSCSELFMGGPVVMGVARRSHWVTREIVVHLGGSSSTDLAGAMVGSNRSTSQPGDNLVDLGHRSVGWCEAHGGVDEMKRPNASLLIGIVILLASPVRGQQWDRFRGPNGSGVSSAATIPAQWTAADYNWKIELPGIGHSSPVLWGSLWPVNRE